MWLEANNAITRVSVEGRVMQSVRKKKNPTNSYRCKGEILSTAFCASQDTIVSSMMQSYFAIDASPSAVEVGIEALAIGMTSLSVRTGSLEAG